MITVKTLHFEDADGDYQTAYYSIPTNPAFIMEGDPDHLDVAGGVLRGFYLDDDATGLTDPSGDAVWGQQELDGMLAHEFGVAVYRRFMDGLWVTYPDEPRTVIDGDTVSFRESPHTERPPLGILSRASDMASVLLFGEFKDCPLYSSEDH